jgi:hypothetical protein
LNEANESSEDNNLIGSLIDILIKSATIASTFLGNDNNNNLFNKKNKKNVLHSLGLVYKSMRGMMTNSIDRDQWLNVTSESRDRI